METRLNVPSKEGVVCFVSVYLCECVLDYMLLSLHTQVVCRVQRDYHGNKCPLGFGPMTCLCAPKCDEGKISVKRDDTVTVTRWQTSVNSLLFSS